MCRTLAMTAAWLGLLAAGCEKTTVEGPAGKSLTLVKPMNSTIERGATDEVSILVTRDNFSDPVTVRFENLPRGVSLADSNDKIEGNQRTFVLKATDTADLVDNHAASVTVMGPDGMRATEQFSITVRGKA